MRIFRRRIRGFFFIQALFLLLAIGGSFVNPNSSEYADNPYRHYAVLAGYAALFLVFANAWWTTRKPSSYRNLWAVIAGLISVALGAYFLWKDHDNLNYAAPGLIVLAIGIGAIVIFGQGGAQPSSESAIAPQPAAAVVKKPVRIAGDRTSPWVNRLVTLISLVAEFGAIFFWSYWAHAHGLPRRGVPWYILFTSAVLLSTLLHECGHAIIAWAFHMRLLSFNAGPVQWRKTEGKWKFKLDLEGFFNLGGAVRVVPTNPEQPRAQELVMIAAGPLANIFFGSMFLVAVLYADWPHYAQTWRLVAFTASFCFIAAITNLFPFMTEDGGYSDGAQILQILTKSPLDDYRRTMNSLASTLVTPRRYKDLDIDAIQRAADRFPTSLQGLNLQLCASNYYWDTDHVREARIALANAEAICSNHSIDLPGRLHSPFVIGHAYLNRNPGAARMWWDRMEAKKPERKNVDYYIAQSALFWIEGQQKEAEEAWQKANAEAQKLPHFGAYEFDRFRCEQLRKELDNPSATPTAPAFRPRPTAAPVGIPAASSRIPAASRVPAAAFTSASFASGTEVAASNSPSDAPAEQPRFDPLQFIRTPAVLEKLRG